jgi:hypothetical protein
MRYLRVALAVGFALPSILVFGAMEVLLMSLLDEKRFLTP